MAYDFVKKKNYILSQNNIIISAPTEVPSTFRRPHQKGAVKRPSGYRARRSSLLANSTENNVIAENKNQPVNSAKRLQVHVVRQIVLNIKNASLRECWPGCNERDKTSFKERERFRKKKITRRNVRPSR